MNASDLAPGANLKYIYLLKTIVPRTYANTFVRQSEMNAPSDDEGEEEQEQEEQEQEEEEEEEEVEKRR